MAGIDLTTADKILKVLYLGPIREMLNNSTVLLNRIEKDTSTQMVSGKEFTIPLHKSRNEAAGLGRGENDTLPTASQQGYTTAVVPNKYIYSSIRVTGPVMAATKGSAQAFVDALTSEMKGVMADTRKAVNRQLHGDGVDDLATYVSGTGSTTGVADDGLGHIFTHLPAGDPVTVDLLDISSSYAVLDSAVTITRGASNGTTGYAVTLSANISGTAADGDVWVPSSTKGKQMMGIAGIISNTDPALLSGGLHGLTVAANPKWAAQVIGSDSSIVDISFPLIQQGLSELAINSDFTEEDIKFFLMNYGVRDKYVELCTNERGWYNVMTIDGGFEAVEYNGKGFVPDNQCKRGRFYGINPDTMKIYRSADFDWMDKDGAVLSRVSGVDAYVATLYHYGDLGCQMRNGNIAYLGIRE